MKNFFECMAMLFVALFVLLTDKEQQRQLDYENGGGEIE